MTNRPDAPEQQGVMRGPEDTAEAKRERLPRVVGHYAKAIRSMNERGEWPVDSDFAIILERAAEALSLPKTPATPFYCAAGGCASQCTNCADEAPADSRPTEPAGEPSLSCNWNQDGEGSDIWASTCGIYFSINDGTPVENGMKFCHNCGKPLTQSPYEEESDHDDATVA